MNKPRHSPGPWVAAGPFAVLDAERNTLVKCAGPDKAANQALIAAAPELMVALKDVTARFIDLLGPGIESYNGNGQIRGDAEAIALARASIAKAEGNTE